VREPPLRAREEMPKLCFIEEADDSGNDRTGPTLALEDPEGCVYSYL
jgi:hypothetical protein